LGVVIPNALFEAAKSAPLISRLAVLVFVFVFSALYYACVQIVRESANMSYSDHSPQVPVAKTIAVPVSERRGGVGSEAMDSRAVRPFRSAGS
jgi:hypothetical protein